MFDPTAFENMKVVMEGSLYDLDLLGEIMIIDRNDLINTAKLSREYELCFRLLDVSEVTVSWKLKACLENFVAEFLDSGTKSHLIGGNIVITFEVHSNSPIQVMELMKEIWGEKRIITHVVEVNQVHPTSSPLNRITIQFDRLILEDQIDDLPEMIPFMTESLRKLQQLL